MPRENRKRGKKFKTKQEQNQPQAVVDPSQSDPSWIKPSSKVDNLESDAPFGLLDADVKAYFRTVDVQIRDWQGAAVEDDVDPNESVYFPAILFIFCDTNLNFRKAAVLYGCIE